MQFKAFAPFLLPIGGAVLSWGLGYRWTDTGAVAVMALLIASAGGYAVMLERQKRR